jgi:hypothetical protein
MSCFIPSLMMFLILTSLRERCFSVTFDRLCINELFSKTQGALAVAMLSVTIRGKLFQTNSVCRQLVAIPATTIFVGQLPALWV